LAHPRSDLLKPVARLNRTAITELANAMRSSLLFLSSTVVLSGLAAAQAPEIIRYSFDNGDATNSASPGVGDGTVVGGVSFVTGNSCTGGAAGAAQSTGVSQIDTGWKVDLGMDSWSVGMHLDLTGGGNGFQYFFGSMTATELRCFSAGAAGAEGIMLRTLASDVTIPNSALANMPTHVVWVYDNTVPEIRGYLNGALTVTVPQANPLNLVGNAADFDVMAYTLAGNTQPMKVGNVMDDFRFYRRAIDQAEIDAWVACGAGSIGTNYCGPAVMNSSGMSATISAVGSDVASDNNVMLKAEGMAKNQFGYFLNGPAQGMVNPPGSQGNLCLSGGIGRYNANIMNSGNAGSIALMLDLPNTPTPGGNVAIQSGETWNFQAWFRDNNPGQTSNFTDGLVITFN
jgi:hypothetical protein